MCVFYEKDKSAGQHCGLLYSAGEILCGVTMQALTSLSTANQSILVCFYDSLFWHCSGPLELNLPTVGPAVSGQEVPGVHSLNTHILYSSPSPAHTAPPLPSPLTHINFERTIKSCPAACRLVSCSLSRKELHRTNGLSPGLARWGGRLIGSRGPTRLRSDSPWASVCEQLSVCNSAYFLLFVLPVRKSKLVVRSYKERENTGTYPRWHL